MFVWHMSRILLHVFVLHIRNLHCIDHMQNTSGEKELLLYFRCPIESGICKIKVHFVLSDINFEV